MSLPIRRLASQPVPYIEILLKLQFHAVMSEGIGQGRNLFFEQFMHYILQNFQNKNGLG